MATLASVLPALEAGQAVRRLGWQEGLYLVRVPGSRVTVDPDRPLGKALPWLVGREVDYLTHLDMVDMRGGRIEMYPWPQRGESADDWVVADWTTVESAPDGA